MRFLAVSLLIGTLLITGCTRSEPAPPPTPAETQAEWITLPSVARPTSGAFWAPDMPVQHPAKAYGQVRVLATAMSIPKGITVAAPGVALPAAPNELPVYVSGAYQGAPGEQHPVMIGELDCEFNPHYSELTCERGPVGSSPITDGSSAVSRVRELTQPLWMDDWRLEYARPATDVLWSVHFRQEAEGRPFYTDRGFHAVIDNTGRLSHLIVRRRPLVGRSLYPVRSPEEALALLMEGQGFTWSILTPIGEPEPGAAFIVTSVEIVYIMPHVLAANELVLPYYLFRNEAGEALFIPAVADPWFGWPVLGH